MLSPELTLSDFTGGITDNFIGRDPRIFQRAKNFLITVDGKLRTRPGSVVDGSNDTQGKISAGVEHLMAPFTTSEKPYKATTDTANFHGEFYYYDGSTHQELLGPTSNHLFDANHGTQSDTRFSSAHWNDHLFCTSAAFNQKVQKVFRDSGGTLRLRTAGLPIPTGTAPVLVAGGGGAAAYRVATVWKFTYTVGNRTFVDRGPVRYNTFTGIGSPPASVTIASDNAIANSSSDNYDTASSDLVLEYYRSIANGTELYLVGSATNSDIATGGASIADTLADATLAANQVIYTSGGVKDNNPPPVCKFMHISEQGLAYYGYYKDGSDQIKNGFLQSKKGDPDSVPSSFSGEIDDELSGISSFKGLPLIFSRRYTYRADGVIDRFGNGVISCRKIADFAGAVSHLGIVQTYFGVFFAGDTGFYWTDGYQVVKISEEINDSYASAYPTDAAKRAIVGTYDNVNQRIYWSFTEATNSDGAFVLDLRYGIKPNSVFTTIGGQTQTTASDIDPRTNAQIAFINSTVPTTITQNFRIKSLLFFNSTLYRADPRGYVMLFDEDSKSDPRVVTGTNLSAWDTTYIYYDFRTSALDFGNKFVRKWTPSITAEFKNLGDISAQVKTDRDLAFQFSTLRELKQRSAYDWADTGILWGDPIIFASEAALFKEKRRLRVPGIRCNYRTYQITNAYTVITKSDSQGLATVSASGKTATLVNAGEAWPTQVLDYYISFAVDGYINQFLITTRNSSTVITYQDSGNVGPSSDGNYAWMIKGYSKNDPLQIQALILPYQGLTDSQLGYRANAEGENA